LPAAYGVRLCRTPPPEVYSTPPPLPPHALQLQRTHTAGFSSGYAVLGSPLLLHTTTACRRHYRMTARTGLPGVCALHVAPPTNTYHALPRTPGYLQQPYFQPFSPALLHTQHPYAVLCQFMTGFVYSAVCAQPFGFLAVGLPGLTCHWQTFLLVSPPTCCGVFGLPYDVLPVISNTRRLLRLVWFAGVGSLFSAHAHNAGAHLPAYFWLFLNWRLRRCRTHAATHLFLAALPPFTVEGHARWTGDARFYDFTRCRHHRTTSYRYSLMPAIAVQASPTSARYTRFSPYPPDRGQHGSPATATCQRDVTGRPLPPITAALHTLGAPYTVLGRFGRRRLPVAGALVFRYLSSQLAALTCCSFKFSSATTPALALPPPPTHTTPTTPPPHPAPHHHTSVLTILRGSHSVRQLPAILCAGPWVKHSPLQPHTL